MRRYLWLFFLSWLAVDTLSASQDNILVQRNLEKVIGTGFLFEVYSNSHCGELLKGLPDIVEKVSNEIEELKKELEPKFPDIWASTTSSESKVIKEANQWVDKKLAQVKELSDSKPFGCGIIFGELVKFAQSFQRHKIRLMLEVRKANPSREQSKPLL